LPSGRGETFVKASDDIRLQPTRQLGPGTRPPFGEVTTQKISGNLRTASFRQDSSGCAEDRCLGACSKRYQFLTQLLSDTTDYSQAAWLQAGTAFIVLLPERSVAPDDTDNTPPALRL